jgi:Immunoglobulin I-set domain
MPCVNFQTVQDKQNLQLTAKVTGKPQPEVKWFKYVSQNAYHEVALF